MKWKLFCVALVGAISFARSAELFVGTSGGDHANLATALGAATSGDTITIRGGYSTPGASVIIPNLTIRGENNYNTNANDPGNLYNLNPSRGTESVVTSAIELPTTGGANPDGTKILGLSFDFPVASGSDSAVRFSTHSGRAVNDVVISNNSFRSDSTATYSWVGSGATQLAAYGWADGMLIENNRMTNLPQGNASAMFVSGTDWTIKDNYINPSEGVPYALATRGLNINAPIGNPAANLVLVGNVFHEFDRFAIQPNNYMSNVVMADNVFDSNGTDILNHYTLVGSNQLISGNVMIDNIDASIEYYPGETTHGMVSNMVLRQNEIGIDATSGGAAGVFIGVRNSATGQGMLIENNQISLTGVANGGPTDARSAIVLGGVDAGTRFDLLGTLTIQNNVLQDTGLTGTSLSVGFLYYSNGTRTIAGLDLNATNNLISGLDYGAFVYTDLLPGDSALLQNNNIQNNGTGVHGGIGGAGIGIGGSYFSGNTTDTSGIVYGTPGGSANTVGGYSASYITFRGDHNLSNAVDASDAAILVANMGQSGPGVTYFQGDSTLNQKVDLDDAEVFARFAGAPITQPTVATATATIGEMPIITYDPSNGRMQIDLGSRPDIWGFAIADGDPLNPLVPVSTNAVNLGAGWFFANGSLILADDLFGTTQNWVADGSRDWVMLPAGLTPADFGGVTYYFGLGAGGGGLGTGSQFFATQDGAIAFGQIPEPTSLAILGLAGLALLRRRRR